MTDLLHNILLWTGITLALLASWVVAPDALGRAARRVRAAAYRYLPFLKPRRHHGSAGGTFSFSGTATGTLTVTGSVDVWSPGASVDQRFQALRGQLVELRELVATTKQELREELDGRITAVAGELEMVRNDVADLRSAFEQAEERSSDLDVRGLLPIGFGILLSGAPDELASVPVIGWPLAAIGVGFVVWCGTVLVKHYR